MRLAALLLVLCPAVQAQFELFRVQGNVEVAVTPVYDLGSLYMGESAAVLFRLRNVSASSATLTVLSASGAGFTLNGPAVPETVPETVPPAWVADFTVSFQAGGLGTYSANLELPGFTVLLTVTVAPSLSYSVVLPSGRQSLGIAAVDFGVVVIESNATLHFTAANQTAVPLLVPAIGVQGGPFSLAGASPSGTVLQPQQQATFDVQFAPVSGGAFSASLSIGDRVYALAGKSPEIPLPKPSAPTVAMQPGGQQGTLTVKFDAAAVRSGTGTWTMSFEPAVAGAVDSTIAFAAGGQSLAFTFSPGDTQVTAAFQAGTTAGTLTFTASIGSESAIQSWPLAPAPITVQTVQTTRTASSVSVQITGFDNTRTAGSAIFTFYDASGNSIVPGGIVTSSLPQFASYFAGSGLGGVFQMNAVFPVAGDTSQIRSVEVQLSNNVGVTTWDRTGIQ